MVARIEKVRRYLIACVLLLLAASCSGNTVKASGIDGTVTIGPTCPESQDSASCPRQPYEAKLVIREAETEREVATVQSGADGVFRVELPPGEYVVEPDSPSQFVPPYADPQNVTVQEGQFTTIEIFYDSGIR